MSGDEILSTEQVDVAMWHVARERDAGNISYPLYKRLARLGAGHEALRAERDVVQSVAERYMGGWEDVVPDEDGSEYQWILEWGVETVEGEPVTDKRQDVEPMTPEQVEWFRAREHRR